MVNVSWNDANRFCEWLSLQSGKKVRLTREAEWQYSCRGGTTSRFYGGDHDGDLAGHANVGDASFKKLYAGTAGTVPFDDGFPFRGPVGQFKPNKFGLHDMHGNVSQWCADRFGDYPEEKVTGPVGPSTGAGSCVPGRHVQQWPEHPACRRALQQRADELELLPGLSRVCCSVVLANRHGAAKHGNLDRSRAMFLDGVGGAFSSHPRCWRSWVRLRSPRPPSSRGSASEWISRGRRARRQGQHRDVRTAGGDTDENAQRRRCVYRKTSGLALTAGTLGKVVRQRPRGKPAESAGGLARPGQAAWSRLLPWLRHGEACSS